MQILLCTNAVILAIRIVPVEIMTPAAAIILVECGTTAATGGVRNRKETARTAIDKKTILVISDVVAVNVTFLWSFYGNEL